MCARSRRTPNQERQAQLQAFHLPRDVRHFLERRRDQPRQDDDVGVFALRRLEDRLRGDHHAEVEHLIVVALEYDRDDVLADVMHVTLDGGEHDPALGARALAASRLLRLDVGHQVRHRLLHDAGGFHDLRQEHLAGAKAIADDFHAVHQRSFDPLDRPRVLEPRLLAVGNDVRRYAVYQRMREPFFHARGAPGVVLAGLLGGRLDAAGELDHPLGGVGPPVEDHVLDTLAQLGVELGVHAELPGIDDAHRHAGGDGVIEKRRVHRLTHRVVAAEREGEVRYAARHLGLRQIGTKPAHRLDVVDAIARVLLEAGGDGEDVRVENDVLAGKAVLGEQPIGALAHRDAPLERIGLAPLIERHYHHGGAVAPAWVRLPQEFGLAFLERNGVHYRLALHAFQTRL